MCAAGGGAELPLGQYFHAFRRGLATHRTQCPAALRIMWEANAGVRLNVAPVSEYRGCAITILIWQGKDGNRDNTLADGAYAGVNLRF
ncbi:YfaZ family protein [Klebsiella pneumoniae]|nr:YfaZ family protein [Klebsiella pneumoniae]